MKDAEKTIGNMIDKQTVSFIASIDEDGFPNMKAMLQPRKREGIKIIYLLQTLLPCVWYNTGRTTTHPFIFVTGVFFVVPCCVARWKF